MIKTEILEELVKSFNEYKSDDESFMVGKNDLNKVFEISSNNISEFEQEYGEDSVYFAQAILATIAEALPNASGGYAPLDDNAKIPLSNLPDTSKQATTVLTSTDNKPSEPIEGDKVYETDTGNFYIYDGTDWVTLC